MPWLLHARINVQDYPSKGLKIMSFDFTDDRPVSTNMGMAVRLKQMNRLRIILIMVGVLLLATHVGPLLTVHSQAESAVEEEAREQGVPLAQMEPAAKAKKIEQYVKIGTIFYLAMIGIGLLYVVFGLIVHKFPVPVAVLALVLFISLQAIFITLDPSNIYRGLIIKVLILVALVGGVSTAISYQNKLAEERAGEDEQAEVEPEHE
jgi:flagellar basal body-associated protein FliL